MTRMTKEQILEKDLKKHIHNKLKVWESDSLELFKMAGLSAENTAADLIGALFSEAIRGATAVGLTDKEILSSVIMYLEAVRKENETKTGKSGEAE